MLWKCGLYDKNVITRKCKLRMRKKVNCHTDGECANRIVCFERWSSELENNSQKRPEEQIMKCQPSLVTINARLLLKRRLPHIIDIIRSKAITRNGVGSRFGGNIMHAYACRGA